MQKIGELKCEKQRMDTMKGRESSIRRISAYFVRSRSTFPVGMWTVEQLGDT